VSAAPIRSALVTGVDQPPGRAIAEMLNADGWAVAGHGATHAAVEAWAASVVNPGGRAVGLDADLAREEDVAALLPRATAALGPLGLLVNAASVAENDLALTATRASWDRHFETNLRAPFVLIQALARQLPAEAEGVVVNILDERAWTPRSDFVSHALSQAGLWAATRRLALPLALGPRIRVNAVRLGTQSRDVAAAVRFILSAPSMTGQMIELQD
jgi:NAD(P)-dependent dehydrogenase (short-subunit alcohol dehydrogenase family)